MKKNSAFLRQVCGVLLFDKPRGITSNTALQLVKHLYYAAKAGHTGSLDPIASGMLPLCFGEATKFAQFLLEEEKSYVVVCQLGITTSTADAEGEIIATQPCNNVSPAQIEKILPQFTGEIEQLPPMYSAIKYRGQPLYKLARQGITVERQPRSINIYDLKLIKFQGDLLELYVRCSKGTYIRTLVSDIGDALGCGAHVVALRRLTVGAFQEKEMVTQEKLEGIAAQKNYAELDGLLLPIEATVANYPEVYLTETTAYYLKQGNAVMVPNAPIEGMVKLKTKDNQFLGIGEILSDGKVAPRRLVQFKP